MRGLVLGAALCVAGSAAGAAWAEDQPASAAAAAEDPSLITRPDWAKLPNSRDLDRVYPDHARDVAMEGRAVVECKAAADGSLRDCFVKEETPLGFGFGKATLAVAPSFRLKPKTLDGKPVDGMSVRIPLRWQLGEGKDTGGRKYYQLTAWTAAPSRADVAAVSPGEGTAFLDCTVRAQLDLGDCRVSDASAPEFAVAAQKLAPRFRAAAAPEAGSRVIVPFRFSAQPDPQIRQKLSFAATPDKAALLAAFPATARAAGFSEGEGRLACVLAADGALDKCRVVGESPTEAGFGAAALALAAQFRFNPWSTDGQAVDGLPIQIPLHFRAEPKPEAKAAP